MGAGRTHPAATARRLASNRPLLAIGAVASFVTAANFLFPAYSGRGGARYSILRGSRSRHFETFAGAVSPGAFRASDAVISSTSWHFACVGDLDEMARIPGSKKPEFLSPLLAGVLMGTPGGSYSVKFSPDGPERLTGKHNEAGRGMELSELVLYNDRLLSFDDRTGGVYEILSDPVKGVYSVPRLVVTEGAGDTDKGMKWEWAAVVDGELVLGSFGKEYTNPDGSVAHTNNLWVAVVNKHGEFIREDWGARYNFIKESLGILPAGYAVHEAVRWSDALRRWIIIPRRTSDQPYDDKKDEQRGGHAILSLDAQFQNPVLVPMDPKDDTRPGWEGVSSFQFVPGTGDRHALVLRTVEEGCTEEPEQCLQETYISVYDVTTGKALMKDVKFPNQYKYEGVEFVNLYANGKKH